MFDRGGLTHYQARCILWEKILHFGLLCYIPKLKHNESSLVITHTKYILVKMFKLQQDPFILFCFGCLSCTRNDTEHFGVQLELTYFIIFCLQFQSKR